MKKALMIALVAASAVAIPSGVALAQYGSRPSNPLEDFLGRIGRNSVNVPMNCEVQRSIDRNGDINWIRMECRAQYRRGR
jgi:hypothetical protein